MNYNYYIYNPSDNCCESNIKCSKQSLTHFWNDQKKMKLIQFISKY